MDDNKWNLENKNVVITGSNTGIGFHIAINILKQKANVIIHGRDKEKGEKAKRKLIGLTDNNNVEFVYADFSSFIDVLNFVNNIEDIFGKIDVLINNAGIYSARKIITEDGYELTLTVNHLSHFLLTNLILELIKKSNDGRIINVSSMIHSGSIDFNNLNGEKYYNGSEAYSLSKLCNILFTYKLARMLKKTNVTVNCLHPGVVNTKLLKEGWGGGGVSVKEGAKTSVYLASSDEVKGVSGRYFVNMRPVPSKPITYDTYVQDKCWEKSMEMVGKYMNI